MPKNKFYITTAIAYTNAPPHIGFALELIQADILARYHRLKGDDTYFLTGTDEHGTSVARAAEKAGEDPQQFVDDIAGRFQKLAQDLNISNDDFIRTSDRKRHWPVVEVLWRKLVERGDLYKKEYEGFYCVGHEAFMKKSDLIDGVCPLHKKEPELIKEENWFFKLTKYKNEIKKRIADDDLRIVPETRKKEILNLIDDAEDVSFSRPSTTLKWGIPVPDDPTQTIYVWADALTNYISALGYGTDGLFTRFWPADVHLIGKDILRFHAMIWPAILLSADIELPKAIYVHGFITVEGQKMSKSLGNVVNPFELIEQYGNDVVRYFLAREIPSGDDGDFSWEKLKERYNGDLANGLGNLVQRVATLIQNNLEGELHFLPENNQYQPDGQNYDSALNQFRLHDALGAVWKLVSDANRFIDEQKPWVQAKTEPEAFLKTMTTLIAMIHDISRLLQPFMPDTAQHIAKIMGDNLKEKDIHAEDTFKMRLGAPLFPKIEK